MTATTSTRPATARPPRWVAIAVAVGLALLLAAYLGGRPGRDGPPLDPRSDGPLGTSALVSLLEELGARVDLSVGLPRPSDRVALLLQDRLDEAQVREVEQWVRAGGTLVVTDPGSRLVPAPVDRFAAPGSVRLEPDRCSISALADLDAVEAGAAVRYRLGPADQSCFGDGTEAFVVQRELGSGQIVAVGGAAFVTNELLGERDNAVLAATLLAPRADGTVRVVEAPLPAGGGDQTLSDLVSDGVRRGLLQAAVAFVLYALWRAIRLGRPVPEQQPVDVAGSELVAAIGRLLAQTRSPGAAADVLRERARRMLQTRLGVPASTPVEVLAEIAAARSATPVSDVLTAIGEHPVTTDAELVGVARAVASFQQEVLR